MSAERRSRRTAAWAGLVLVVASLSALGPASPASAAGCQSEQPVPLPPSACDDTTPPDTRLDPMTPAPNAAGWTRSADVTFTFAAVNTDASDTDEMRTECRLQGPSQAHDWTDCTSPRTYTGLDDTTDATSYTFTVRAYDATDRGWDYDDPMTPLTNEEEVPDEDATPASTSWQQDTSTPQASLFKGPYDAEGTGWPIVDEPRVTYLLTSSEEQVTYRCQLDGRDVACGAGENTLEDLAGGNHVFTATVRDRAGNEDTSPAVKQFVVPHNLTKGKNWKKVRSKASFDGDVMQTKRAGARIKFRAKNIREFRLIAPAGKKLGKVRVRVGTGYWKTYNLAKPKPAARHHYVVRDAASPLFSGRILVESLARNGKKVRVDALVFPPTS